jgi:PAS domain S-box-containing protein
VENHETKDQLMYELTTLESKITELGDLADQYRDRSEKLAQREKQFRTIADLTYDCEYWMAPDGHFIYVSPSCECLTGYGIDQFYQEPDMFLQIVHTDDQALLAQHMEEELETEEVLSCDFRIIMPSGEERWIGHICQVVRDDEGNFQGRRASNRDITDRKRIETELRRNIARAEALAQLSQALAEIESDYQAVVKTIARWVAQTIGDASLIVLLSEEGELINPLAFYHPDPERMRFMAQYLDVGSLPTTEHLIGRVAQQGQPLLIPAVDQKQLLATSQPQYRSAMERFGIHSLLIVPLRVQDQVIGALGVTRDTPKRPYTIDDQNLLQAMADRAALGIANARLLETLQQELVRRKKAEAKLQTRNEELNLFARTVAHDLQNPLALIIGFSELLVGSRDAVQDPELRKYIHTLARNSRKMANIIDELLLLSSVRQREQVPIGPLNTEHIIDETLVRLAYLTQQHQAEIIKPETWPEAIGYDPWIEEVWVNYISNAIKYGGDPPYVQLGATKEQNHIVRFWVRDNGTGLSLQDQARLFRPFTQLDQVRAKGHGLGLSIVKRIVERLGGTVGVESELGQGSVFSFTLPAPTWHNDADPEEST